MKYRHILARQPSKIIINDAVLRYPTGPFVRGSIKSRLMHLLGGAREVAGFYGGYVTAIDGVTLDINAGERVGIIGRNGAGKSTLLRAMAGIFPLESGSIEVHGNIQTLFNIDLGFEAESTGRENILYRGLAMGVGREVISAREQEIVDFASIGAFIDLPMRTYSTGMAVRLAFAIASYLDGSVLLIDEIFGAGDASFQQRAITKMETMMNGAEIVVFVSHDVGVVQKLCTRVIWMDHGMVRIDGSPETAVAEYLKALT